MAPAGMVDDTDTTLLDPPGVFGAIYSLCLYGPHTLHPPSLDSSLMGRPGRRGVVFWDASLGSFWGALGPQDVPLAPSFHTTHKPLHYIKAP